jgi:hypothetical protein
MGKSRSLFPFSFSLQLLLSSNLWVRYAAVREFALGWKDEPWMFKFFCYCAVKDSFQRQENWELIYQISG